MLLKENGSIVNMGGCNGVLSWYIGPDAVPHESKPTAGNGYQCQKGYELMPLLTPSLSMRLELKGKKKVADRMAWVVRVRDSKSASAGTYYFHAETFLLLRREVIIISPPPSTGLAYEASEFYSDYRDVGGIKLPFMTVQQTERSSATTILREVEINAPIDDARFQEPKITGAPGHSQVLLESSSNTPQAHPENPPPVPPNSKETATALQPAPEPVARVTSSFVSASIAELQQYVPELKGLKTADDQLALAAILDKIGQRILDVSSKIPNLICHEEIEESEPGGKATRENFSYLILARRSRDAITLDEFRTDLKTGATLETDDAPNPVAPEASAPPEAWHDLAGASQRINTRSIGRPPLSLGFAYMWVRFHPSNRSESTFRYLGQQKMDGHRTLVVAFAQKPGSVRLPSEVRLRDKTIPVYYQGIAWVDPSDFRILRLQTDLLAPPADLPLNRLTSRVQFASTQAAGFALPLWLPREVAVTSQVNGHTFHDRHRYSNYRLFRAHAKLVIP
jgi:hypothetical protein